MSRSPKSVVRPSLAERFARKEIPVDIPATATPKGTAESAKDDRVQVLVRMKPAERKALRRIALDQDTTVQAIVEDAIRDVLRRHESMSA